jgi:hypothetical protein
MFESTIPFGEPELMRASAYQRYLDEVESSQERDRLSMASTWLSPSLLADLLRFEEAGQGSEALEVMAACVRHSQRVTLHLQCGDRVVPLTVFPQERLVHCPMPMSLLLKQRLPDLKVMHVEPALLRPPGNGDDAMVGEAHLHHPLAPLLWELAMRGARNELLPEISGPAAYRLNPGLELGRLPVAGALLAAVKRLRRETTNLRDMADWPGLDRERAIRLLNALYLQAGLIVSRTHPDAASDSWFGALGR